MLDEPEIVRSEKRIAAVIHMTVPRDQMQTVMGPSIGELMGTVSSQGRSPAGPLFSHHLKMTPEVFDFELGVPVDAPIEPAGRVKPGELPEARVARTVYHGGYEGLGEAWGEFEDWIDGQEGVEPRDDLWECYLKGPESGPDPSTWRTELNRPLEE